MTCIVTVTVTVTVTVMTVTVMTVTVTVMTVTVTVTVMTVTEQVHGFEPDQHLREIDFRSDPWRSSLQPRQPYRDHAPVPSEMTGTVTVTVTTTGGP